MKVNLQNGKSKLIDACAHNLCEISESGVHVIRRGFLGEDFTPLTTGPLGNIGSSCLKTTFSCT